MSSTKKKKIRSIKQKWSELVGSGRLGGRLDDEERRRMGIVFSWSTVVPKFPRLAFWSESKNLFIILNITNLFIIQSSLD
jgi:hypothetical protein